MRSEFDSELEERLVRYAAVDTQSDEASPSTPSSAIQLDLSRMLEAELVEMGAEDVVLTPYGAVLATIPATVEGAPVIGFCAHVDTAPAYNATGVKPVVHRAYNGGNITFADAPDLLLSPENAPLLAQKAGEDIITASGTTLLGADDKAGVAIIMSMARHLLGKPGVKHGKIRLALTPDEEIARGVHPDLPADLGVDFAYTLDGSDPGELNWETFSADGAVVRIEGVSAHPGWAKDKLVNALHLAGKLIQTLPQATLTPETTDGREGFIMLGKMEGNAAEAELSFILRDFELEGLAAKGALLRQVCEAVAATEPRARVSCEITPQYRNMRYWLERDMAPVDLARAAYRAEGLEPVEQPIRGGTDGSKLTELGVPCPNIFCGMQEIHGPLEWVSVQDMALGLRVCLRLVERAAV